MKWLHKEIVSSRTYQLGWQTNETNKLDARNFSHSVVRRLPAEVAYDAIRHATASDGAMAAMHRDMDGRYIGVRGNVGFQNGAIRDYALSLFGKNIRSSNCDCDRSSDASLLQTVFMQNDREMLDMLERKDSWLAQLAAASKSPAEDAKRRKKDDAEQETVRKPAQSSEELIVEAYLRTLGRLPNDRELKTAGEYLAEAPDTLSGLKDVLWALINTKEFIVNR
jgi:hypothetical protein